MSRDVKTKALWCKKATVSPATGSLQQMVEAALRKKRLVADRREAISADGRNVQVIAQWVKFQRCIAGVFTGYERGAGAVTVDTDPNAEQLQLAQLLPPKTDGKDREWAEGLLYFLIYENIVVMIQSAAVRQRQFEEHLSWLLKKDSERVGPAIVLADQAVKSVRDAVKKSGLKHVIVGGPLVSVDEEADSVGNAVLQVEGAMLDAVKNLLPDNESFKWSDGLDGNIEATLHLSYVRKTTESGQQLLNKIGMALRNVEGVEVGLELNNGQKIKGKDLCLTTNKRIPAQDGVLMIDEAFKAMHSWMVDIIEQREVT